MIGHSSFLLQIPFSLSYTHFVAFKGGRRRVSSRVQQQALLAVALNGVIKLEGPVESATKSFLVSTYNSLYVNVHSHLSLKENSINTVSVLAFENV